MQSVNELWWWGFFWSKSTRDQQTICAPYLSKVNSLFLQVLLNLKYCYILLQLVQIRLLKAAQPPTHWNAHTRTCYPRRQRLMVQMAHIHAKFRPRVFAIHPSCVELSVWQAHKHMIIHSFEIKQCVRADLPGQQSCKAHRQIMTILEAVTSLTGTLQRLQAVIGELANALRLLLASPRHRAHSPCNLVTSSLSAGASVTVLTMYANALKIRYRAPTEYMHDSKCS